MWKVAALYRFIDLTDLPTLQTELRSLCDKNDICGTLLLAPEGINGTIAGAPAELEEVMAFLEEKLAISKGEVKFSSATEKPFMRMKVRLKKEIVTLRAPEADPNKLVGTYIAPENWNEIIEDPEVVLVDTRNTYETKTGIFKGALDPQIENFTDFKDFVSQNLDPKKHKKVAMYCTGGIRCEKASSYMLAKGFDTVYHLKGGILKYLETIPVDQSHWDGECFVFDKRVTVAHGLAEGQYEMCFGCREPLGPDERDHPHFEEGVSCPSCYPDLTAEKAEALRMRHKQMNPAPVKDADHHA